MVNEMHHGFPLREQKVKEQKRLKPEIGSWLTSSSVCWAKVAWVPSITQDIRSQAAGYDTNLIAFHAGKFSIK
jgi:hypothetical protein